MSKKYRGTQPDDFFSMGPLQVSRYGKNIIYETNWPAGDFKKMQQNLAEKFQEVVQDIDSTICKIVDLVASLPPVGILQRAYGEMSVANMGISSEFYANSNDCINLRMIDYLQSIIASVKPKEIVRKEIEDADWQTLRSLVEHLFNRLNLDYQICRTSLRQQTQPDLDMKYEEFYYKAQMYWCNIRGDRYLLHDEEYLRDIITIHSGVLSKLFGITAEQLITEISKIQQALTRGLSEAGLELLKFQKLTMDALEPIVRGKELLTKDEIKDIALEVFSNNGWKDRQADIFGRFFGLELFDLEKVTQIPPLLLKELSWEQGQDNEFFAAGEYKGWPLRIWPIYKRPFIKLNGRYYCFDLYSFRDNFYRVLQKILISLEKTYQTEWNKKQKEVSEELPFKYLQKILPKVKIYRSVHYKWYTGDTANKQWCETDGLLIFDDHLFIVEVKAGAFTYTPPASDFPAYIESIKNLVLKPVIQGKRFLEYLKSEKFVSIYAEDHTKTGQLSSADFRHITICTVTLDSFTELAAQTQQLNPLGIAVGDIPVWSISIDDLRVYSDIFSNPLIFLHFVEQRIRGFGSKIINTEDELDHLGLYIKHNIYTQYAKELQAASQATRLNFIGYRVDVDKFFTEKFNNPSIPSPINQKMPENLAKIINLLAECGKPGRASIASFLLDCDGDWRDNIANSIDKTLENQILHKRPFPFSTHGDTRITIFCWQYPFLPRNKDLAIEHSKTTMLTTKDEDRLLLELYFTIDGILEDIEWTNLKISDFAEREMERLQSLAASMKTKRIANAGKIGRNDTCPCGSGKKYKKCCIKQ